MAATACSSSRSSGQCSGVSCTHAEPAASNPGAPPTAAMASRGSQALLPRLMSSISWSDRQLLVHKMAPVPGGQGDWQDPPRLLLATGRGSQPLPLGPRAGSGLPGFSPLPSSWSQQHGLSPGWSRKQQGGPVGRACPPSRVGQGQPPDDTSSPQKGLPRLQGALRDGRRRCGHSRVLSRLHIFFGEVSIQVCGSFRNLFIISALIV